MCAIVCAWLNYPGSWECDVSSGGSCPGEAAPGDLPRSRLDVIKSRRKREPPALARGRNVEVGGACVCAWPGHCSTRGGGRCDVEARVDLLCCLHPQHTGSARRARTWWRTSAARRDVHERHAIGRVRVSVTARAGLERAGGGLRGTPGCCGGGVRSFDGQVARACVRLVACARPGACVCGTCAGTRVRHPYLSCASG